MDDVRVELRVGMREERRGEGTYTVGCSCADEWSDHLCVDGVEADVGGFDDNDVWGKGWKGDVIPNRVVEFLVGDNGALGGW